MRSIASELRARMQDAGSDLDFGARAFSARRFERNHRARSICVPTYPDVRSVLSVSADVRVPSAAGCALFALVALGGCNGDERRGLDKPVAPPMETLAAYGAPTAAISIDALGGLRAQAATFVSVVDQLGIENTVLQSLRAGLAQIDRAGATPTLNVGSGLAVQQQALTLPGNGYLEIRRICDGWGVVPVADPANGELQLIAGFDEDSIDPVVWGTLSVCRYRLGEHFVELDGTALDPSRGDLRVYIGPNVAQDSLVSFPDPLVVELAAQVTIDGRALASELDFRIDPQTRALELLVPLGAGHALVQVDPTRGALVARGSNGTFSCETATLRCFDSAGQELSVP